jgi:peptidoglycan/xylan/chitin deacetylase (PgdA/CDA1 family)
MTRRLLLISLLAFSAPVRADGCESVDSLEWLLGNWESKNETSVNTEFWTRVSENAIEVRGMSLALPDFNLTFLESIVVAPLSGTLYYTAKVPQNRYPVSFELTECSENNAVFENADHDFPSRIAYSLEDIAKLRVDVSGPDGDGFSINFSKSDQKREIALTFDDAPRKDSRQLSGVERTNRLIDSLKKADSPPAIFFSTTSRIDESGDSRMRAYQAAGHYVGNHTHSHQRISDLGVDAYVEDIKKAHEKLSQYDGFVPLFRYPFLDEGRDIESRDRIRQELSQLGYSNGYVTVDNYDFYMDSLLQRALENGQTVNMANLRRAYVDSLMESVRFYSNMAEQYLGRNPVHSILLHENDLAALFIGDFIKALHAEGWTIVDAREAYKDPIARQIPDTLFNGQGRVGAIARANGIEPSQLVHRSEDTGFLEQYFEGRSVFGDPPEAVTK